MLAPSYPDIAAKQQVGLELTKLLAALSVCGARIQRISEAALASLTSATTSFDRLQTAVNELVQAKPVQIPVRGVTRTVVLHRPASGTNACNFIIFFCYVLVFLIFF